MEMNKRGRWNEPRNRLKRTRVLRSDLLARKSIFGASLSELREVKGGEKRIAFRKVVRLTILDSRFILVPS